MAISGGTPELTVAYTARAGQKREVRSLGSDLYARHAVGDAPGVYHELRPSASARLDLFAERWKLPMILDLDVHGADPERRARPAAR